MSNYNPDGVNRIVRVVDLDNPKPGDTDEVKHCAEAMLVAFEHRNKTSEHADHDWRNTCGLDLDNSDMWIPEVPCLGGVIAYAGDDLDSLVALQWRNDDVGIQGNTVPLGVPGRVVAIVVQDVAAD